MAPLSLTWPFFYLMCLLRHTNDEKESQVSDMTSLMNNRRMGVRRRCEKPEQTFPCCTGSERKEHIELIAREKKASHFVLINEVSNHHGHEMQGNMKHLIPGGKTYKLRCF